MPMSWEQYSRMEEEGELSKGVGDLEKALKAQNEGKNQRCWPLVSFGWKDADLDPEGCCGIKEIVNYNTDEVTVLVGGHKTFCPPENASAPEFPGDSLIAGCKCEWTGEEWVASFEVELKVEFEDVADGVDFDAHHAELIIKKAEELCAPFQKNWEEIEKHLDSLAKDFEGE
jgi:hypothetical protein